MIHHKDFGAMAKINLPGFVMITDHLLYRLIDGTEDLDRVYKWEEFPLANITLFRSMGGVPINFGTASPPEKIRIPSNARIGDMVVLSLDPMYTLDEIRKNWPNLKG